VTDAKENNRGPTAAVPSKQSPEGPCEILQKSPERTEVCLKEATGIRETRNVG